jgi:hypothetical protein
MRFGVRFSLLALLVGVLVAVAAPAAAQGAIGIEKLVAVNCDEGFEKCGEEPGPATLFGPTGVPKEPSKEEAETQGYTQAGGHVPFGVTDFKVTTVVTGKPLPTTEAPTAIVKHLRTDVAPGLATSPSAVPQCSGAEFGEAEALPKSGLFLAPTCSPETEIGKNEVTVYAGESAGDVPISGKVYNLVQREGLASEFGVALKLPKPLTEAELGAIFKGSNPAVEKEQYFAHTLIEGNVEWGKEPKGTNEGDYHDYFEVNVSESLPLIRSRLVFKGRVGNGSFITNATSCPGHNTTRLSLTGTEETTVTRPFTTPIGLSGCDKVPFEPSLVVTPGTTAFDQPDEITTDVGIPRHTGATEVDSAQLKTAEVKLPEGMTLNPSAAAGLAACTPAQAQIHSAEKGVHCPAASEIGTVEITVPTLPEKEEGTGEVPLKGKIYLGGPESGPITGPPYVIYLDAESKRYGVSVRIKGETIPNEATGQVTTVFNENPEQPFTKASLHFGRGALTAIANPLTCGSAASTGTFVPYTTPEGATKAAVSAFTPTGCPNPIPFAPTQSTSNQTTTAGGNTSYTFSLTRPEGNQYLSQVKTTLPPGLVGQIPKATQCTEAQATSNTCPATSQIGTASAISGSGPTPFTFGGGTVYLTGPYHGAPFGLSIVVPAVAGPFNLGLATTRASINVDPYTARVTTTALLPTIVRGGILTRLRSVTVSINKQGFLLNPTSCNLMATESTVTSTFGASQNLSTPFQVGNCNALKFKPAFKAKTSAKTSKANGASLETTLNEIPGQANVKSVKVQLPKLLPSRLTTLQKACPAATFESDPFHCPAGSFVGGARANTPTLVDKLKGPAILVSHAAAAFPDLDLVMEADGVRSILVGNTDIKKGITTTTFASTPDVPVSSITVNLPVGSHSALTANGNLCANKLVMPTTITGQNGTVVKQNTNISVANCGVRIVGHKAVGNTLFLTVQTFAPGRVSAKGGGLATAFRRFGRAQKRATLRVSLSRRGRSRHKPFRARVRVGFVPRAKGAPSSAAFVTVRFR